MQPELVEDLSVEEPALRVEALLRAADRNLGADNARAGDAEDPLQVLLRPEGAELARAGADHRDRLVAKHRVLPRPRSPVDRVLEAAGDRAVVLGRREENRVGGTPLVAQAPHRLEGVALEVVVVQRELAESLPELELDPVGRGLDRSPQEARVERALPQAAGNGEHTHRQLSCPSAALTSARSALMVTSSPR